MRKRVRPGVSLALTTALAVAALLAAGCGGSAAGPMAVAAAVPATARTGTTLAQRAAATPAYASTPGPESTPGGVPVPALIRELGGGSPPGQPHRVAVAADREATVLAAAVAVPGSAWELPGTEGLTLLSATTLLEEIRPALERLGARARVRCDPASFTFTLVAPRDTGEPALQAFLDGLFRPTPTVAALGRARAWLAAALALDRASPAWQARLAVRQALFADTLSSGWLGPACGVPETLDLFDLMDVRAGARRFAPGLAHVAIITPSESAAIRARVESRIPGGPAPPIPAPRIRKSGSHHVERNTVTEWTAVAFPFGPGADLEALRLLGALLQDAIGPGVERPESYTSDYELLRHGAGGALVIQGVSAAGTGTQTMERVEQVASGVAWTGTPDPVFERVALRHRGLRLLELAAPEARAAAMARDLAFGRTPEPWPNLDVSRARLQAAARALRPPARAVVGPAARGNSMP